MKTELTKTEQNDLIERIAQWSVKIGIGSMLSFILEVNRPMCPLTGNAIIAFAPFMNAVIPFPFHMFGILIQDDSAVKKLQKRIEELSSRPLKTDF